MKRLSDTKKMIMFMKKNLNLLLNLSITETNVNLPF